MITLCVLLGNLHIRRFTYLHATLNSSTYIQFKYHIAQNHTYAYRQYIDMELPDSCR